MAAGWMTALKLVPWGDVIEATPQILQAAKKLMGKTKAPPAGAEGALAGGGDPSALPVGTQIAQLQARVAQLEQEQRDSALLIQSLAEQNAQVVSAVGALRQRTQRLAIAIVALGALCAGLLVWVLRP